LAADLYQALKAAGLSCLNDPARVMCRVEFLKRLHHEGINPFTVHRADEPGVPARLPAFLRFEDGHDPLLSPIIDTRDEFDRRVAALPAEGISRRGVIAVEYHPAPYGPGLFHKWGTFRIGDMMSVDHIAIDDTWYVKTGVWEKLTEGAVADEHDAVTTNRYADVLRPVFDIAGIDFGRADHATVDGRTVVYEINTNPRIGPYVPDSIPLRFKSQTLVRTRFAEGLARIDTADEGTIAIDQSARVRAWREKRVRP